MTDNDDVVYACYQCDRTYKIKSSFQSHMRMKHKGNKVSDIEKGQQGTQKKPISSYSMWVENELEIPHMSTREFDPFLANRSDFDLAIAAVESEKIFEAENVVEKLKVKSHELDWFQEDNDSNFMKDVSFTQGFTSEFASSLRRESLVNQPSREKVAEMHNISIKSLNDKNDAMVVRTRKIIAEANITKTELRKN